MQDRFKKMPNRLKYRTLFQNYYPQLLVYAKSIVGESDAEDVVEDVFMYIWNHQDTFASEGDSIRSYLYRAVYTRSLNVLRHRKISSDYLTELDEINEMRLAFIASKEKNAYQMMENNDLRKSLMAAIDELPPKRRYVFILSYIKGVSSKEIAEIMDISVRTVETQLCKALHFLREKLSHLLLLLLLLLNIK